MLEEGEDSGISGYLHENPFLFNDNNYYISGGHFVGEQACTDFIVRGETKLKIINMIQAKANGIVEGFFEAHGDDPQRAGTVRFRAGM